MSDFLEENKNTGFVAVEPNFDTDNIRGGETSILDVPVLDNADWRPFLPTNVTQLMKQTDGVSIGDTNACVSFGGKQSVETQLNHQIETGVITVDNATWLQQNGYLDASGRVLLSARFTAKMSGTDPNVGNSLPNVWASLQNDGCVPESVWPMPDFDECSTTQAGWNLYYQDVPEAAIALGKEFAARFPILSEWLVYPAAPASGAQLLNDLKVSPLEIATAVCAGWNTDDPIQACGPGTAHATLLTFVEASGLYDILDHYNPYQKQFAGDYNITYGFRGVVGQPTQQPPAGFHYTFTKQLTYNGTDNDPTELQALQTALQTLKQANGQPYMTVGVFGPYGPQTKAAVALFQQDHNVADANPGADFGPQTRAALNAALASA